MADTKKKSEAEMEKEKKEESRSVNFKEKRDDLFREAAKLVSEDPSRRIAILVTPPPSESDVSIQSFGYPSAQDVVQRFLEEEDGEEDDEDPFPQGPFWWEDDKLLDSKNQEQLMAVIDEISRLKNQIRTLKNSEQLKAAIDESSRRKNHILMSHSFGAGERGQGSGNQENLNNDQAGPKP